MFAHWDKTTEKGVTSEFPSVIFNSGNKWVAHHAVDTEKSTQVDGKLTIGSTSIEIDMYLSHDSSIPDSDFEQALYLWNQGTIHWVEIGVTSLVIPKQNLSGPVIEEALRRFLS